MIRAWLRLPLACGVLITATCDSDENAAEAASPRASARASDGAGEDARRVLANTAEVVDFAVTRDALIVAQPDSGQVTNVPRNGEEPYEMWDLSPRRIRALAVTATHAVMLHFEPDPELPTAVLPPGHIEAIPLAGGEPVDLFGAATSSAQVVAANGVVYVVDRHGSGTRIRVHRTIAPEPTETWTIPGFRHSGQVAHGDDLYIAGWPGIDSGPCVMAIDDAGRVRTAWESDVVGSVSIAAGPNGLLVAHSTGSYTEPRARLDLLRPNRSHPQPLGAQFGDIEQVALGPQHACIVERGGIFRNVREGRDTFLVTLGDANVRPLLVHRPRALCLAVDERYVFLATERGVERLPLP